MDARNLSSSQRLEVAKNISGYLKPTTLEVSKNIPVISDIKGKIIHKLSDVPVIYKPPVSTMNEGCKSPEMIVASIISDEELVETGIMQYVLPSFALHKLSGNFYL